MNIALILLVCFLTCVAQLCQKKAVQQWQGKTLHWRTKVFNPWLITSIACLGFGMLLWLNVLRLVPLNVAYPMLSLNFVFVALASHYWFGERTNMHGWIGIMLIIAGVVLLGGGL